MRYLQQDYLENLFGCVRQRQECNTNPTVPNFTCGLKQITIQKITKLSDKGNVDEDLCTSLRALSIFIAKAVT